MPENQNQLISVVGPTAVGKTELTIELAELLNTEIVSADSRQFFREMTIGTAKPSATELGRVKHYFINSHSIETGLSAGGYEKECLTLLIELLSDKNVALLTGGSGLYIKAVLEGLPKMPEIDAEIRDDLNTQLKQHGIETLKSELLKKDPTYYHQVDLSNPQRVIRALEVINKTGKLFSSFRNGTKKKRPFDAINIGLNRNREILYTRINDRVDQMMSSGLLEEVRSLQKYQKLPALQTVGYKELFEHINGQISLDEAIDLIKRNTRRYAKRQLTWFRKDSSIKWFEAEDKEGVVNYIKSKIR